jgi:hypothetical protein
MKTKKFIHNNLKKDKIIGRPIRLNRAKLIPNKDNYVELLFFGDLHLGHPECDIKKAKGFLDWALKNKSYIIGMGDYIEAGLINSVGDSVYQQELNPQKQMDEVIELLRPLADAGLIIGLHEGNHEDRILKTTSINVTKLMCKFLNIPYLGYSCWNLLKVGKQNYTMYTTHGSSGSKFKHTKLKAIMDILAWIKADIVAMGHVHSIAAEPVMAQQIDLRSHMVVENKCYAVLTGSYLRWDNTYAQSKNLPITKLGSPKAKLRVDYKDVHFTL